MPFKRHPERDPERIEFARSQRQASNEFSKNAWQLVRAGRMLGEKFRREYPLGPYTLDFVCLELKLNIEIDGKDHLTEEVQQNDRQRDAFLRGLGYEVLRIQGYRVMQEFELVREEIQALVRRLRAQNPSPRSGARGVRDVF